jgi:hypothetical protein
MKFLAIFLFLFSVQAKSECSKSGSEIMRLQEKYHRTDSEHEIQKIVIKDVKSGATEKRDMERHKKTDSEDLTNSLVVFKSPSNIKGTALLSHEQADRGDDQWLYVPELRKTQRIAPSGKKNYFMGTDFTFADMENENLSQNKYTCEKEGKCGKASCFIILAEPKSPKIARSTGYSKRKLWIRTDSYITLRIKYYDRKGADLKVLTNSKWKKYGKTAWRPQKSVMKRPGLHETEIKTIERKVDIPVKDLIFQERYLLKGMHL